MVFEHVMQILEILRRVVVFPLQSWKKREALSVPNFLTYVRHPQLLIQTKLSSKLSNENSFNFLEVNFSNFSTDVADVSQVNGGKGNS